MKRLHILLVVSLLLNLFLAGTLAGGWGWTKWGTSKPITAGSFRGLGSELPDERREALRKGLRAVRKAQRPATRASRVARHEAAALLRSDRPDRPRILDLLARARAADMRVRAAVEQEVLDFATTLPASQRSAIADAMIKRAGDRKNPSEKQTAPASDASS